MKSKGISISIILFAALLTISMMNVCSLGCAAKEVNVEAHSSPGDDIRISYNADSDKGIMAVSVTGTQKDISLLVSKDATSYTYKMLPGEVASIPLNMGSGDYLLDVRLYVTQNMGEIVWSDTVSVELKNFLSPFLSSSKIINWSEEMELAKQAKIIASGLSTREAALAISEHVGKKLTYSNTIPPSNYIPDLEAVYAAGTGICYDYAALYAAMCRSAGIPCTLKMGYSEYVEKGVYHAWCQVYVDGEWLTVDSSCNRAYGVIFLDSSKTQVNKSY